MNKTVKTILSAIACISFTSCALLQGTGNVVKGSQGAAQSKPAKEQAAVTVPAQDSDAAGVTKTPLMESLLLGKLNGEWTIIECPPYSINQDEDYPYVMFDESDGRFYASNGCNILNGSFEFLGSDELTFSNVLSTMKACPDIEYQYLISTILRDGNKVKAEITQVGDESYLNFTSPAGAPLMTMRKHNMEKLNGKWEVVKIKDMQVDDPEVNIFFDIPELTMHGNTGCNYFNGSIQIDPQMANSISFSQMAVTSRACPDVNTEMALLVALEETSRYKLHDNKLLLYGDTDHPLVILARTE